MQTTFKVRTAFKLYRHVFDIIKLHCCVIARSLQYSGICSTSAADQYKSIFSSARCLEYSAACYSFLLFWPHASSSKHAPQTHCQALRICNSLPCILMMNIDKTFPLHFLNQRSLKCLKRFFNYQPFAFKYSSQLNTIVAWALLIFTVSTWSSVILTLWLF